MAFVKRQHEQILYPNSAGTENVNKEEPILAEIIAGCCKNIPSFQEELYNKFYGYAMAVALKYCSNTEDGMEVVNDSFIKVFTHIKKFNTFEAFKPWLRKIVVNTAIDKIRANRKFPMHADIYELPIAHPVGIESELDVEQIYNLLDELPDLHRYVFNLYEIDGYNHREIGSMLRIPESSSRTYLARAKAKLRLLYTKYYLDSND